ncbi:hypothetical protein DEU56DRAFT_980579 [Suillus clintonianus]|uniref:uncharacterized protein n=1 Tax=Suillus clintonianus TaxID=1904413 RepID=UPI001B877352|nr:uncharacterized protein DEU56DRAFT_980579 [Suillus clintonianus]KAG2138347.1 hypothetical protein DEU56DRAFT_980579 [Suillus clintonianus]
MYPYPLVAFYSQERFKSKFCNPHEVFSPDSGIMALSIPFATGGEKARLDIAIDVSTEWGPKVSHFFLINEALRATGACIGISEEHSRPAAFVLDFSPASVRWARGEVEARRGIHGALVTEASVLRPGRLLAEEVVSSLPYTRTMLAGYLPQHQIQLSRDEVVYPYAELVHLSYSCARVSMRCSATHASPSPIPSSKSRISDEAFKDAIREHQLQEESGRRG